MPTFAPYTTRVFKVDLLYYLGIDRGFISGERASNKADMAYLYYLPFTMVSGDEADYAIIARQVPVRKGKWRMVSQEIEDADSGR